VLRTVVFDTETAASPSAKKPKLLAGYSARQMSPQSANGSSLQQLNRYLETDHDNDDCLALWHRNRSSLDKLAHPTLRALSVSAASSAVECVLAMMVSF